MKYPNFFIVGAPKCGTTTVAEWLRSHPRVFLSTPKELDFFDTDHKKRYRDTWERYISYFLSATDLHIAVGEASVGYLRSNEAITNILSHFPNSKFIVCIRNPIEMAFSWHNQLLNTGWETVKSFEKSWNLQNERLAGYAIPRTCPEPSTLIYRDVCALGTQLEKLYTSVPRENVLTIILDDLMIDPEKEYHKVLYFLGLPVDDRHDFPALNTARHLPRSFAIAIRIAIDFKQRLGFRRGFGLISRMSTLVSKFTKAPDYTDGIRIIGTDFEDEIAKLERLLNRDLSSWRNTGG